LIWLDNWNGEENELAVFIWSRRPETYRQADPKRDESYRI